VDKKSIAIYVGASNRFEF